MGGRGRRVSRAATDRCQAPSAASCWRPCANGTDAGTRRSACPARLLQTVASPKPGTCSRLRSRLRPQRRANAAGTHFTFEAWEELIRTHGGRCAYCGSTDHLEADHRIPLCRGGTNEINNILPACRRCNRRKHRKTEEEFRAVLAAEGSSSRA
ncbi:MAG TPA: HNH endonuclease signature motif containing protein [Candidatus Limnocylindria bacterium]|nr:HNH endonuclease signature motif containing protein [Candidatus Limnocylindria bacterium]